MKNSGFTIVELMVVVAILAILLSVAPPTFNTFIKGSQMTTNSNDLIGTLNFARMEAVKRGRDVGDSAGGVVSGLGTSPDELDSSKIC